MQTDRENDRGRDRNKEGGDSWKLPQKINVAFRNNLVFVALCVMWRFFYYAGQMPKTWKPKTSKCLESGDRWPEQTNTCKKVASVTSLG